ncbi:hypothetical protein GCM10011521_10220 [Arenimonas soli]|uniref:DUF3617 domain-containing protein n=1 Tax=Arenimonas soli TaxID=2269504 RepID=A0ABQ1HET3_9GAMM|nr:hypothetical protein [Arenimonas soli]GGA73994.1 hypothetical protein GCM10011521_10220 [Arenimonas soli]
MSRPRKAGLLPALMLLPSLALAGPAPAPAAPAADPAAANLAFAAALEACVEASHQSPHPFVRDFVIEHTVSGMDGELCGYSQTMPGDMRMACELDEPARVGLAAEFRELAEGRMSGGTGEQPAWTGSCEVITADGESIKLDQD